MPPRSKKSSKANSKSQAALRKVASAFPPKSKEKNKNNKASRSRSEGRKGKAEKLGKDTILVTPTDLKVPKGLLKTEVQKKAKTVAKIPAGREDSSSNWKALLQMQGKSAPSPSPSSTVVASSSSKSRMEKVAPKSSQGSDDAYDADSERTESRSSSRTRCSSTLSASSDVGSLMSTDNDSDASQKVKQQFRALGLANSTPPEPRPSWLLQRTPKGVLHRNPPPVKVGGKLFAMLPQELNEFGFFSYSHYGVLRTQITQRHLEFMEDSGIIAMDCEMVGVGPMKESALARVSIVNQYGYCLYDRFVKPRLEVTDYRTQYSGIRECDLMNAVPFQTVTEEVAKFLRSHILVGHSLKSDLSVLFLNHPKARTRDTAFYFKKYFHSRTPKLKMIVKRILNIDIQEGEHNSIIDAQATMALYLVHQREWEIAMRQSSRGVDVLKETLQEFQVASQSRGPLPRPSLFPSVNQPEWYDDVVAYNYVFNRTFAVHAPPRTPELEPEPIPMSYENNYQNQMPTNILGESGQTANASYQPQPPLPPQTFAMRYPVEPEFQNPQPQFLRAPMPAPDNHHQATNFVDHVVPRPPNMFVAPNFSSTYNLPTMAAQAPLPQFVGQNIPPPPGFQPRLSGSGPGHLMANYSPYYPSIPVYHQRPQPHQQFFEAPTHVIVPILCNGVIQHQIARGINIYRSHLEYAYM